MLSYLSADIMCSAKRAVSQECSSRKTVSFEEQIMFKDKFPSIFWNKMEAIVFITCILASNMFCNIHGFEN